MISKKVLLLIFVILILIIVCMIGWRSWVSYKFFNGFRWGYNSVLSNDNTPEGTKPLSNLKGEVTEDIYVEILAQTGYQYQTIKNPELWAERMKAIYAKYGVTGDDIKAYAKMLESNPEKAKIVSEKYMKRLVELQNFGK